MTVKSKKTNQTKRVDKNPLYVVTNKGRDVQSATHIGDAIVKKLGLSSFVTFLGSFLEGLWQNLWAQVNSYAVFLAIKRVWDEIWLQLERLVRRIDPLLAFTLFQH